MFIFKTSGATYESVIQNQKHAFRTKPRYWNQGEIVLVSKNKNACTLGEKQIQFTMRINEIRDASDDEIETYWPGNRGRWNYIVDCTSTEPVPEPFDLDNVLGDSAIPYKSAMTFMRFSPEHERLITPLLTIFSVNTTDEVETDQNYSEGALKSITVNAYERDPNARAACITHFGYVCQVCGFNYEQKYHDLGKEFIHVHHIIPLADIGQQYSVNPITDMIPLCANCHAMIHRRRPALTIDELRNYLNEAAE